MNIPYQKERIKNAISFLAKEYKSKTSNYLPSIYLYKFVALIEFNSIKKYGQPVFGFTYKAMKNGPVPLELYENKDNLKTDCYEFNFTGKAIIDGKEVDTYKIISTKEPDLDYFSDLEIDELYNIIEIFADKSIKSKHLIESSHTEIYAWRKKYEIQKLHNSIIEYIDEFPGNIKTKPFEKLSLEEENILLYQSMADTAR